ncbi:MAG: hypothetical protein GX950_01400 [Candidatus Diapherotrites archaeon]|jgi:hypothetical protein|uniref:Uncharacterized protein n=1 Tax=Candidatus Iainarchaeum sp. TaxID=3101447 RepID=A0A7K4BZ87_9ARCH|nr:hypothetical protein [Candidatus Diapherotrites archaeon]
MNNHNYNHNFFVGKKGQFFSPDMIIAIFIFVVTISFFFISSENIYQQIALFEERKKIDEIAHSTMNFLIYSQGIPSNWEYASFEDINFFGLASERNTLSKNKLSTFFSFFNQDYEKSKEKLGIGGFDFKLIVYDSQNNVIFSGGVAKENSKKVYYYDRVVLYDNSPVLLRGVFYSAD